MYLSHRSFFNNSHTLNNGGKYLIMKSISEVIQNALLNNFINESKNTPSRRAAYINYSNLIEICNSQAIQENEKSTYSISRSEEDIVLDLTVSDSVLEKQQFFRYTPRC